MPDGRARALALVQDVVVGEDGEGRADEPDHRVGQMARAAPGHVTQPALDGGDGALRSPTGGERLERGRDRGESVHARTALARALAREVARDASGLDDAAAQCRERGDDAAAERRAGSAQHTVREHQLLGAARSSQVPK